MTKTISSWRKDKSRAKRLRRYKWKNNSPRNKRYLQASFSQKHRLSASMLKKKKLATYKQPGTFIYASTSCPLLSRNSFSRSFLNMVTSKGRIKSTRQPAIKWGKMFMDIRRLNQLIVSYNHQKQNQKTYLHAPKQPWLMLDSIKNQLLLQ